jgi:hypothetical protein
MPKSSNLIGSPFQHQFTNIVQYKLGLRISGPVTATRRTAHASSSYIHHVSTTGRHSRNMEYLHPFGAEEYRCLHRRHYDVQVRIGSFQWFHHCSRDQPLRRVGEDYAHLHHLPACRHLDGTQPSLPVRGFYPHRASDQEVPNKERPGLRHVDLRGHE